MTDVRAEASSALQAAKTGLIQSLQQNRLQQQQTGLDYAMGVGALNSQALAGQQSALQDQLAQNLIVSGQESQMDILKTMYENQLRPRGGGSPPPGRRRRPPTATSANPEIGRVYRG
jgi:hypothetical protein